MSAKRGQDGSPGPSKRVKQETPNVGDQSKKELSRGAQWLIQQVEAMQKHYKDSVMAATSIIQFKTYAKKAGLRQGVPKSLYQRLEQSWAAYDVIRGQTEWYINQNAVHAATPSNPATAPASVKEPPLPQLIIPHFPDSLQNIPKASPIPLSTASLLAYDSNANQPPSSDISIPNIPNVPMPMPQAVQAFNMDANVSNSLGNTTNQGPVPPFSANGQATGSALPQATGNFGDGFSGSGPGSSADDMAVFASLLEPSSKGKTGLTPQDASGGAGQSETDRLLASLGQDDNGDFNFIFGGDLDNSTDGQMDYSELASLLGGGSTGLTPAPTQTVDIAGVTQPQQPGKPGVAPNPPPVAEKTDSQSDTQPAAQDAQITQATQTNNVSQSTEAPPPTQPPAQPQAPSEAPPKVQEEDIAPQSAAPEQAQNNIMDTSVAQGSAPAVTQPEPEEQTFDFSTEGFGENDIDMNDFNFGAGDDDAMPTVDGEDFERMFAEFK